MHSDLRSTRLAASGQVSGSGQPCRVVAIYFVAGASAGSITLKNGGSSGTSKMVIDTPAGATLTQTILMPENGMRFTSDCYATLSNVTAVTFVWEG